MRLPWGSKDSGAGRRRRERTRVRIPCKLVVADHQFVGNTIDLSLNGVLMDFGLDANVPGSLKGEQGWVSLLLPTVGTLEIHCKAVRISEHGCAVNFTGIRKTKIEKTLYEYLETQLGEVW